ncbi:hypothetical protein SLNWT_4904 [Streptomyces albus]|uniref:Uncharacterized protein n=1 Tax=Streptomyces albus (strain ATCC 21838 / DSM 41398 / FERM P-419 / JCM 4703 / NBRC 107858) TaxID=1081613 RepID=A0A0B5F133_STRA4|nr:hypothetical protein SLNWT_4904 [Streptomyces albus]AOU79587.1 hypothetical protein SLNHY_4896 [Streptomyces albus]AYN35311.1 hypothetical protein DUI70_4812 [Streptomyces albus]
MGGGLDGSGVELGACCGEFEVIGMGVGIGFGVGLGTGVDEFAVISFGLGIELGIGHGQFAITGSELDAGRGDFALLSGGPRPAGRTRRYPQHHLGRRRPLAVLARRSRSEGQVDPDPGGGGGRRVPARTEGRLHHMRTGQSKSVGHQEGQAHGSFAVPADAQHRRRQGPRSGPRRPLGR